MLAVDRVGAGPELHLIFALNRITMIRLRNTGFVDEKMLLLGR
jgi:hypothetical protein